MSLKTWKAEFYPKPADRVAKKDAVAHSLRKWEGLTKANLKKHGVRRGHSGVLGDGAEQFVVSAETCALCVRYLSVAGFPACVKCPLALVRGGVRCDVGTAEETKSPYHSFTEAGDARPMIRDLREALKAQEKGK